MLLIVNFHVTVCQMEVVTSLIDCLLGYQGVFQQANAFLLAHKLQGSAGPSLVNTTMESLPTNCVAMLMRNDIQE